MFYWLLFCYNMMLPTYQYLINFVKQIWKILDSLIQKYAFSEVW